MKMLDRFKTHRMPTQSALYDRVIPALFLILSLVMIGLVIFALGVVTQLIPWS